MSLPAISHASHTSYGPFCHAVCCPQRVLCGPRRNFVCPGDMSQQILPCPTPSPPSPSAVVVLVFHGGLPRFPSVIGCVLRGNLINCLATSTLLLFWHKIPFYFYLPWPIFGLATSYFDSFDFDFVSILFSPPTPIVSIFYLLLCVYYLTLALVLGQAQNCDIS